MRRLWLHILFTALLPGILSGMTSCRQKGLVFPEAGMAVLDVKFEWPDTLTERPEGMTLWFFSHSDDCRTWRFDIAGHDGGLVELPYGEYTLISCNNDVTAIRITDTSGPRRLTAALKTTDSLASAITPLHRALAENVSFSPGGLRWTEDGTTSEHHGMIPTLTCHPAKISTSYDIEFRRVQGLERLHGARLKFHGVCSDLLLYDARSLGSAFNFLSDLKPPDADATLSSSFESFGPILNLEEATIEIIITLTTRRIYRKTYNVGDLIANRRDRFRVKIVIEGLSIPDSGEAPDDNVGMEVGVDGWTEINIDYSTGA